jgi:hypothetical protein
MTELRSFKQLISDGFLVANSDEPEVFEYADDNTEIMYHREVVDNFYSDEESASVEFCSPCGMEHVNEYDCMETKKVFSVYRVTKVQV